jgi:microcystin-dependent protein
MDKYILLLISIIGIYFYKKGSIDNLIMCLLIAIFVIYSSSKKEHVENISPDKNSPNEAIQNLSSMYNKGTVKATNLEANNLSISGTFDMLPKGVIVAWNGTKPPKGWALCDGENGTPDLRGRFIRMYSDDIKGRDGWAPYVVTKEQNIDDAGMKTVTGNSRNDTNSTIFKIPFGKYGGTDHQVLSLNEMPKHNHGLRHSGCGHPCGSNGGPPFTLDAGFEGKAMQGEGWGHNNMPPFYVLSYIIKE